MAYIEFIHINKSFGPNAVLRDVSLHIEQGQLVTLLGPSGCGKSTLLRTLAGLETPSSGRIMLDGEDITHKDPRHRNVGMVFQQYSLFPKMSVAENIAFGLRLQRLPSEHIRTRVAQALEMVDLKGRDRDYPGQLSGGQQQRVALARSIVMQPKVLLLDEPLSAIDAKLRRALQVSIRQIQKSLGITAIFVTHDQDEAMILSDVIHLMSEGRVEQSGKPIDMYTAPQTRFAAGFIGHYNILTSTQFTALTGQDAPAGADDVAFRPETVEISARPQVTDDLVYGFTATVEGYIPHGNVLRYTVGAAGVSVEVDVLFRSFKIFDAGQTVYLTLEKRNCLSVA